MPFWWLLLTLCFASELLLTFTGTSKVQRLRLARVGKASPATKLENAASSALRTNQAFYRAFNAKDLDGMSKLWASEVTKWGPLLFFQDRDESFKMSCTCTHPNGARLQGWNRIFSSSTLPSLQISKEQVLVTCEDMAVVVCQASTKLRTPLLAAKVATGTSLAIKLGL